MTTPSVTLRSLKNDKTGIDISVPHFEEEEAPLGGTSILYEISVLTNLDLFKTSLHKSEDIVHFSLFKAYREIEEFHAKLKKKYPNIALPSIPKSSLVEKFSNDEKLAALNLFMEAVSKHKDICSSPIFTQFIGLSSQRISTLKNVETSSASDTLANSSLQNKSPDDDDDDIFLKIKKKDVEIENKPLQKTFSDKLNEDLFASKIQEISKPIAQPLTKEKSPAGLFDEFDDDNLFSSTPVEKNIEPKKTEKMVPNKNIQITPTKKVKAEKFTENVDDSEIIIKDRKQGDVSLFEEQDFGDYITKEEEALFLVTPSNNNESKKNSLLFLSHELPSSETDSSLNDNLDDLLNLEPLPSSPIVNEKRTERASSVAPLEEESPPSPITKSEENNALDTESKPEVPSKPMPLPRKKSIGKTDVDAVPKPEVLPRKIFLDKPKIPSKRIPPAVAAKPSKAPPIDAKPAPPPKPKPPPLKPKPSSQKPPSDANRALDVANANRPETKTENLNTVSDLTNDLKGLDILKYIEQEQKTLEAETNLFD